MSTNNKKFGFKRANELRNASEISTEELTEIKSIIPTGCSESVVNVENLTCKNSKGHNINDGQNNKVD